MELNKLLLHQNFFDTLSDLSRLRIRVPFEGELRELDFDSYLFPSSNGIVNAIEKLGSYKLNAKNGEELANQLLILAYDESIKRYSALEGTAYLISHALVCCDRNDYVPLSLLTFYFYTQSKILVSKGKFIKSSDNPERDSKKDYVEDRTTLLAQYVPDNSLLFIDGPLIGGQISSYTVDLNQFLLKKSVLPIFVVKNTSSNLVTKYVNELAEKYNSDLHWAFDTLQGGERTSFFRYADPYNPENAKIFCYLKGLENKSPIRIEFHFHTYQRFGRDIMKSAMDLVYYLLLLHHNDRDLQLRPIAIAEKYAREVLKLIDLPAIIKGMGLISTINQERFGW
jgi:hypothetical protein